MLRALILFSICILTSHAIFGQSYQIAVLKYKGGGDYYANPTSLPNLVQFANKELKTTISKDVPYVEVGSTDLFNYPFVSKSNESRFVETFKNVGWRGAFENQRELADFEVELADYCNSRFAETVAMPRTVY